MGTVVTETLASLAIAVNTDFESGALNSLAATGHRYLKDLKVNVSNALQYATLSKKESYLLALAVAANDKHWQMCVGLEELAQDEGATDEEIAETYACVSLLNVNNVFYRFRHFTHKEFYDTTPAGIKMTLMANPVLGKEFFELTSLAVSALNGCQMCVASHEASLMHIGTSQQRVYDAVRLAAVMRGLTVIG